VAVAVLVAVGVSVGGTGVFDGVWVEVAVWVAVFVEVELGVFEGVNVAVGGIAVLVDEGVAVGASAGVHPISYINAAERVGL